MRERKRRGGEKKKSFPKKFFVFMWEEVSFLQITEKNGFGRGFHFISFKVSPANLNTD